jgi:hypothetical protein
MTQNLALAQALVEAARNLRTAKLDTERIKDAARKVETAIAAIADMDPMVDRPAPATNSHVDEDVRRALAPLGVLSEELAENAGKVDAVLKKLGEDLLRAAQTLGQ